MKLGLEESGSSHHLPTSMNFAAIATRIALPVSVFAILLLGGAVLMGLAQGGGSFSWMLVHGASGPFVGFLLHGEKLSVKVLITAIVVLALVIARGSYPSTTIAVFSVLAIVFWIVMGWGAAA